MTNIQIKNEYPSERCEVCHQADCFDASKNYCSRCVESGLNKNKSEIISRHTLTYPYNPPSNSGYSMIYLGVFMIISIIIIAAPILVVPVMIIGIAVLVKKMANSSQEEKSYSFRECMELIIREKYRFTLESIESKKGIRDCPIKNLPQLAPFFLLFTIFRKDSENYYKNLSKGKAGGTEIMIFDYVYINDSDWPGSEGIHYTQKEVTTFFFNDSLLNLPNFYLYPVESGHKNNEVDAIDFSDNLSIPAHYAVQGGPEEMIKRMFDEEMRNFLESHRGFEAAGSGNKLVFYREGNIKPEYAEVVVSVAFKLFILLKNENEKILKS